MFVCQCSLDGFASLFICMDIALAKFPHRYILEVRDKELYDLPSTVQTKQHNVQIKYAISQHGMHNMSSFYPQHVKLCGFTVCVEEGVSYLGRG